MASRVIGQAATALPEVPVIGLEIRTPDARNLEAALHAVLRLRGRQVPAVPGKEWFNTSPSELENLYGGLIDLTAGDPGGPRPEPPTR